MFVCWIYCCTNSAQSSSSFLPVTCVHSASEYEPLRSALRGRARGGDAFHEPSGLVARGRVCLDDMGEFVDDHAEVFDGHRPSRCP
jgi:hypothetical protein